MYMADQIGLDKIYEVVMSYRDKLVLPRHLWRNGVTQSKERFQEELRVSFLDIFYPVALCTLWLRSLI